MDLLHSPHFPPYLHKVHTMEAGKMGVWIVVATCFWWNSVMSWPSSRHFPTFIRTVADEKDAAANYHVISNSRISGPNGYCVDVKDGFYNDGDPIILWPCKSGPDVNQLWTFESDGTVRSNGKCLTASGYNQGSRVMIYNCSTAAKKAAIWELRIDGSVIVNSISGLVLTAISGQVRTELTLEPNIFSTSQTWRVDNDTTPSLVSIVGFNGLCLQAHNKGYIVRVEKCKSSSAAQRWLLYPDGTIRPEHIPTGCVSYDKIIPTGCVLQSCGLQPTRQRWLFTKDGTILNERSNLVLEVSNSNPDIGEVVVYPANGQPNQKWEIFPLNSKVN